MADTSIDLAAIQAEIDKLSPEQQAEQLLKMRVTQVKQSKKFDKEKARAANKRRRELFKALKANAEKNGTWGAIDAKAKEQAGVAVGEAEADETGDEDNS